MDWYRRSNDSHLVCYRCAVGRLRDGETPLLAIPRDFVGPQPPDWLQCADCHVVFERVDAAYVPRRDMEDLPDPTPSESGGSADTTNEGRTK
ncbi:hypothetical protein LCGC14_2574020 [marine sediment metagenome]|uniref:Uncharacterized protein n=1 Tax=marine sediment metagenome TaxID=412755 RepID=A0A0F9AGE6_9ZZZZ